MKFLDHTAVRFVRLIFVVIDADKKNFSRIAFKRLRIMAVFNLPDCGDGAFVIFELNEERRLFGIWQRQKNDVRKTAPCWQLADKPVIFSGTVVCQADGAAKGVFIVTGQDRCSFRVCPVQSCGDARRIFTESVFQKLFRIL